MTAVEIKNRYSGEPIELQDDCPRESVTAILEWCTRIARQDMTIKQSTHLCDVDLSYANLRAADLGGAGLCGVDLSYANLSYADLGYANLGGADLGYANLGGANLRGANLRGANLGGGDQGGANLRDANLGGAVDIHKARNIRPSSLLGANWTIPDNLVVECVIYDAANHDNPDLFRTWIEYGTCPFGGTGYAQEITSCGSVAHRRICVKYGVDKLMKRIKSRRCWSARRLSVALVDVCCVKSEDES